MADGEDGETGNMTEKPESPTSQDSELVNGDAEAPKDNTLLSPEYNLPDQVLPRRSSLVKDKGEAKRKEQRKKTVSFSSMPNEKTVSNGECKIVCLFCHFMVICFGIFCINCIIVDLA